MIENPPLDEDLLIHFGIKGMHWGHRKVRADEEERKSTFQNADRKRKIVIGLAVVGGAAAVGLLMSKRGRTKVIDAAVTNSVMRRSAASQAQAQKKPFTDLLKTVRNAKASSLPSPDQMVAEARMAGVRNRFFQEGNRKLTDRTWRDQARLASLKKDMENTTSGLMGKTDQMLREAGRRAG